MAVSHHAARLAAAQDGLLHVVQRNGGLHLAIAWANDVAGVLDHEGAGVLKGRERGKVRAGIGQEMSKIRRGSPIRPLACVIHPLWI